MATFKTAASNGIYAKLVITEQSQSIENNTTTLKWEVFMWNTTASPNWYMYDQHNIFRVKINNVSVLDTNDFGRVSLQYEQTESTARLITSGTTVIAHETDGTKKSVPVSFYAAQGWEYAYVWETSGTMNLTTIARASQPTLSASSVTLGSPVTIYTNRASTGFTHTLEYSIGSASGTIATGVGASYDSWKPDKSLANQFPNTSSGVVTITCKTYNGSTLIGSKTVLLNVKISSDMIPSVSATISEAASIPSGITGYIKTRSKLRISVTASGSYGSTIQTYNIKANGSTYTTSEAITEYLTTAGTNTITVTVTDSRGQSKAYETSVIVIDYSAPKISSLKAFRCDSGGNENTTGAHMKVVVAGAVTSLSDKNAKTCTLYYKKASATSWTSQTLTLSAYSFSNVSAIVQAETTSSYDVKVVISDSFNSAEYHSAIGTAQMFMNVLSDKSGAAIGKMAEKAKTLQLGWDLETHGALNALEGVSTSSIINSRELVASLSSPGWYRIFTSNIADSSAGSTVNFTLAHSYYYNWTEVYDFSVSVSYGGYIDITQLSGVNKGGVITKIRVLHKNSDTYYIDFYYATANLNPVWVHGSGCGTFCVPTTSSIPDGYSAVEFDTTTGCKSSGGFNGNLEGNIVKHTAGEVTRIHNTSDNGHSYAYFAANSENKCSVGYFNGMAYIGEELGSCARIGVTSEGVPQFWSSYDPSTAKNLLHTGNITSHMTHMHYGTYDGSGGGGYYKININSTEAWMLCFTIRVYQGYRATDIMVSGYNYGQYYWHDPSAVLLGDSDNLPMNVYFGYDSAWNLWVAIPIGEYTGLDIFNVTNGYAQVIGSENLFSISRVGSLSGTTQTTVSALPPTCSTELITSKSGIWNWVKYNSGLAMCWGQTAVYNTTFPSTWGSWRVNDYLFPAQRFPFDFVAIPQVFASQGNPGTTACDWAIYSDGGATTQYTPKYSVFRPAAVSATVNLSLNLFAIGRWK